VVKDDAEKKIVSLLGGQDAINRSVFGEMPIQGKNDCGESLGRMKTLRLLMQPETLEDGSCANSSCSAPTQKMVVKLKRGIRSKVVETAELLGHVTEFHTFDTPSDFIFRHGTLDDDEMIQLVTDGRKRRLVSRAKEAIEESERSLAASEEEVTSENTKDIYLRPPIFAHSKPSPAFNFRGKRDFAGNVAAREGREMAQIDLGSNDRIPKMPQKLNNLVTEDFAPVRTEIFEVMKRSLVWEIRNLFENLPQHSKRIWFLNQILYVGLAGPLGPRVLIQRGFDPRLDRNSAQYQFLTLKMTVDQERAIVGSNFLQRKLVMGLRPRSAMIVQSREILSSKLRQFLRRSAADRFDAFDGWYSKSTRERAQKMFTIYVELMIEEIKQENLSQRKIQKLAEGDCSPWREENWALPLRTSAAHRDYEPYRSRASKRTNDPPIISNRFIQAIGKPLDSFSKAPIEKPSEDAESSIEAFKILGEDFGNENESNSSPPIREAERSGGDDF